MDTLQSELRSVVVQGTGPENEGLFHGWCREPFFNDAGGYIAKTYALIELANGKVKMVDPTMIKFKQPLQKETGGTALT